MKVKRYVSRATLAALALALAGCASDLPEIPGLTTAKLTDAEQISQILDEVQQGMQARRIFSVMAHVSRSYKDREGRDYDALAAYLNAVFKAYREVRVHRVKPRIAIQGTQARAVETFGTIAKPNNPAEHPPIDLHGQVTVYLEKVDGAWKIVEWGSIS